MLESDSDGAQRQNLSKPSRCHSTTSAENVLLKKMEAVRNRLRTELSLTEFRRLSQVFQYVEPKVWIGGSRLPKCQIKLYLGPMVAWPDCTAEHVRLFTLVESETRHLEGSEKISPSLLDKCWDANPFFAWRKLHEIVMKIHEALAASPSVTSQFNLRKSCTVGKVERYGCWVGEDCWYSDISDVEGLASWKPLLIAVRGGHFAHLFRESMRDGKEEGAYKSFTMKEIKNLVTELYSEMVVNGAEYAFIVPQRAFLFLRLQNDNTGTILYHFSEVPVASGELIESLFCQTHVSQILGFALRALSQDDCIKDQKWRFDRIQRQKMSAVKTGDDLDFSGISKPIIKKDEQSQEQHVTAGDDNSQPLPSFAVKMNVWKNSEYCTMKCLRGLMNDEHLDRLCPNYAAHQQDSADGNKHPTMPEELLSRVNEQIQHDMGTYFQPLGLEGNVGKLFRIKFVQLGYTFVAKGVTEDLEGSLRNEHAAYERMQSMQGKTIPVCLGFLESERPYILDSENFMRSFLLLSWSGDTLNDDDNAILKVRHKKALKRAARQMERHGVKLNRYYQFPREVHWRNVLWSEERKEIVIIDFEKAVIRSLSPDVLDQLLDRWPSVKAELDVEDFEQRKADFDDEEISIPKLERSLGSASLHRDWFKVEEETGRNDAGQVVRSSNKNGKEDTGAEMSIPMRVRSQFPNWFDGMKAAEDAYGRNGRSKRKRDADGLEAEENDERSDKPNKKRLKIREQ